jgi:hypothetical protein
VQSRRILWCSAYHLDLTGPDKTGFSTAPGASRSTALSTLVVVATVKLYRRSPPRNGLSRWAGTRRCPARICRICGISLGAAPNGLTRTDAAAAFRTDRPCPFDCYKMQPNWDVWHGGGFVIVRSDGVIGVRAAGVAAPLEDVRTWSVLIAHKHRKEAVMNYYAGMDVPLEETSICIVDETGRIVKETRAASEPPALIAALEDIGRRRVGRLLSSSRRFAAGRGQGREVRHPQQMQRKLS